MILNIDDWKFEVNVEDTRGHSSFSASRHCTCAYCENYYRGVDYACPGLRRFLDNFGVDIEGPVEMYPFEPTICLMAYRVTGKILEYGIAPIIVDGVPIQPKEEDERQFKLEVGEMQLPWLMLEDPEEVVSPANEPEFLERMYEKMYERHIGDFIICS